jgi:hypothetical protein
MRRRVNFCLSCVQFAKQEKKRPGAQLWPVSLLRIQINSYSGCISPQIMDCVANSEIFQRTNVCFGAYTW